jgi:hypothetical protein
MVGDLFPRMVIMDEGRIVADGPADDLLRDVELLEAHGLESPYIYDQFNMIDQKESHTS